MSQPNPFAFTGLNASHIIPSEASLRAEIARLNGDKATLQRNMQHLEDANGVARALADAKNQVQVAQRETRRAGLAERDAREALAAGRNTQEMSQNPRASHEDVEELRKVVEAKEKEIGKLMVELETCKGLLDNLPTGLGDTSSSHDDCKRALQQLRGESNDQLRDVSDRFEGVKAENERLRTEVDKAKKDFETVKRSKSHLQNRFDELNDNFERRVYAELEDANKTIAELQAQRQDTCSRLSRAETDYQELTSANTQFKAETEHIRSENMKLETKIKHQDDLTKHMSDINNNLSVDLAAESAKSQILRRERNGFEERLAEAQLALRMKEKSEDEAFNALAVLRAETELAAYEISLQNDGLQDDVHNLTRQVDEHEHALLIKDERIACLEQENTLLESRLMEEQSLKGVDDIIDRPTTNSSARNKSIRDELEGLSDLEDDQFSDTYPDIQKPKPRLELSIVYINFNIAPHKIAAPRLTVSVSDAIATSPLRQDSFIANSPASNVSSVEPTESATSKLSMYSDVVVDFAPSDLWLPEDGMMDEEVMPPTLESTCSAPPTLTMHIIDAGISVTPILKPIFTGEVPDAAVVGPGEQLSAKHILSRLFMSIRGVQFPSHSMEAPSPSDVSIITGKGFGFSVHCAIHMFLASLIAILVWRWWIMGSKLWAWEHANGVGFGEGYGNAYDDDEPYGNGHVLLGMLPHNLLSADSPLPFGVVEAVTKTVNAFESFIGFGPGQTMS